MISIDIYHFNRYTYIDAGRSGADPEAEAPARRALLRPGRLPRRRAPASAADGPDRQGAGRPDPVAARRRPPQARRQGLRVRADPAVRRRPADRLPSPQGPAQGRHRRFRARGIVGLLLRQPRGIGGTERMAEQLSEGDRIRNAVRQRYAAAANSVGTGESGCCGSSAESSCGCGAAVLEGEQREVFGEQLYSGDERESLPDAARLASLGCGNPTAVAELNEGETVLDLGSGGGIDVLLSAKRVGRTGKAYGIDMTDEMLELARCNQREAGIENAEFFRGTIEAVPLPDASVDVVISNCVINLSADKPAVFREAARVLRPGGRFAVSDIVADSVMDDATRADMEQWTGC